jgi:serpin B
MKFPIYLIVLVLLFSLGGCKKDSSQGPGQPKAIDLPAKGGEVISGSNAFGIDLFRLTAQAEQSNLMLSPLSASTALTMLLNGCNAQTYDQIRDMLGYDSLDIGDINAAYGSLVSQLLAVDPGVNLALANAVFYRDNFTVKTPFLDALNQSFQAEIAGLNFNSPTALTTINGWAKENTNGKIEKVLDEIDPMAVMFLMNALYFKGTWTYKFGQDSYNGPFYTENGGEQTVVYMHDLIPLKTYSTANANVVELPYGNQNFAMDVILPEGALSDYLTGFDNDEWATITAGLDALTDPVEVNMIMPRFKFSYEKYLNDQLMALGMTDAFDPDQADLSGISDEDIYVSFVKQNTFVEVNEDGTEAAAVTTIGINVTSIGDPVTFTVDKPFIFAIRERTTNTLLFIGKVAVPEE